MNDLKNSVKLSCLSPATRTKIKNVILGPSYDLSLAFIGSQESRRLNKLYRGKNKPADVLSFPLTTAAGEILIDRDLIQTPGRALFLFIHGLLHLKGLNHGSTMMAEEKRWFALFSPHHAHRRRRLRYRQC